ncbi:MAG: hypothetical protein ACKODS_09180 [Methylophilaceae bacterium]
MRLYIMKRLPLMNIKSSIAFAVALLLGHVSFAQRTEGDTWAKVKTTGSGTLAIYYSEQGGSDGRR